MTRGRKQFVWFVAACAVVAQAPPAMPCFGCDRPCCADRASGHAAVDTDGEVASGCPLCSAAHPRPADTSDLPCRCQLDARHDQPVSLSRGADRAGDERSPAHGPAVARPPVPPLLGISREYLATSLAVPIRPPRVLFGVWRN